MAARSANAWTTAASMLGSQPGGDVHADIMVAGEAGQATKRRSGRFCSMLNTSISMNAAAKSDGSACGKLNCDAVSVARPVSQVVTTLGDCHEASLSATLAATSATSNATEAVNSIVKSLHSVSQQICVISSML